MNSDDPPWSGRHYRDTDSSRRWFNRVFGHPLPLARPRRLLNDGYESAATVHLHRFDNPARPSRDGQGFGSQPSNE